jgi:NADH-quinone oxidoreductase subunit C
MPPDPVLPPLDQIKSRIEAALPHAHLGLEANPAVPAQASLVVDRRHALEVARYLRDTPGLQLDYCSNVTGADWLEAMLQEKVPVKRLVDGVEKEIVETVERRRPARLEAVYHLYSMALKHGPLVLRQRTANRAEEARLTSLTPIWRSAEYQEREVFDLFGVHFEGHPDLRRILMWDEFQDFPMRKDYVEPDDYEYEPTPHDDLVEKARRHYPLGGAS